MFRLFSILALFLSFILGPAAQAKSLAGDWISAGDAADSPAIVEYKPTYKFRYDCQWEISTEQQIDPMTEEGIVVAFAKFTLDNDRLEIADTGSLNWKYLRLDLEGREQKLPAGFAGTLPSVAGHSLWLSLAPDDSGKADFISLSLRQQMPLGGPSKLVRGFGSFTRNDRRLQIETGDEAEIKTPAGELQSVSLKSKIFCRKSK